MQCVHCGSAEYVKNGKFDGNQRYKCKSCFRTFSDKPRRFTYADKEKFLFMYLNGVGIRKAALFMGCSSSLLVRWIREFASNLRKQLDEASTGLGKKLPDIIEMDEIYTRVKRGETVCPYGLLILEGKVKLLRMS